MITKQELIDIMKEGWQPNGYYSVNFNANMVADKILEKIEKELEDIKSENNKLKVILYGKRPECIIELENELIKQLGLEENKENE